MRRPPHHAGRVVLGVAAMAALWLAGLHVRGLDTGLMFLVPAFVLLLPLLAGRYLGERELAPLRPAVRRAIAPALHVPRLRARLLPAAPPPPPPPPPPAPRGAPAARAGGGSPRRLLPRGTGPTAGLTAPR